MIKPYLSSFCRILVMLAGFLFICVELSVPADLPPEVGTFLVASETLVDPRFRKSVILLVRSARFLARRRHSPESLAISFTVARSRRTHCWFWPG